MLLTLPIARKQILKALSEAGFDDARIEADIIIERVTGFGRAEQILNESTLLTEKQSEAILDIVSRRLRREPLDHILGYRAFYGLEFKIDKHVLSPRPETEQIVDYILRVTHPDQSIRLLDLGTGSGAITIALLKARKKFSAVASDISIKALDIAKHNAARHGVSDRLEFVHSDWFHNISGQFDYILSNPPYIVSSVIEALSPEVREFDPAIALDGGPDGLEPYRVIAAQAFRFLHPEGIIITEIGYDQGTTVPEIFKQNGYKYVRVNQDLSGHDRIVIVKQ